LDSSSKGKEANGVLDITATSELVDPRSFSVELRDIKRRVKRSCSDMHEMNANLVKALLNRH
jgi:hypothetical protein